MSLFAPLTESGEYPIPGMDLEKYYPNISKFIDNGEFMFDIMEEMTIQNFSSISNYEFKKIANCVYNTRNNFPLLYNKDGTARKKPKACLNSLNDEINVVGYLPLENMISDWESEKSEWVYAITWNGRILKIGQTSVGMKSRFDSYQAGNRKRMLSGSPSTTNFVVNEVNYLALSKGYNVEIYACKLEPAFATIQAGGIERKVPASISSAVETLLTEIYAKHQGKNAPLCGQKKQKV